MADGSLQGGLVVCARWRLRGRLSKAGDRSVWEAENIDTHQRGAIKFLARPPAGDAGARRRFEREVRSLNKVRSPQVSPVIDYGVTEGGVPFVVTELLHGQDLGRLLGQERVLGLIESGRILDEVCRGLHMLHAVGLAHGNLRPENVFLTEAAGASVRLLGFGFTNSLAGESTRLSPDGIVVGVSPLVSPELLEPNTRPDVRSDVWALGALAYRMLTGVWPFDVHNWVTLAQSIRGGKFMPVSERRKDLPLELDRWFGQTLQPDLARRFRSVEEARVAFERIAHVYTGGMLAQARPSLEFHVEPPPNANIIVHPPSSRPRRRPRWQIAGVALIAAALAGFALQEPFARWTAMLLEVRSAARRPAPTSIVPKPSEEVRAPAATQPTAANALPPAESVLPLPAPVEPEAPSESIAAPKPRVARRELRPRRPVGEMVEQLPPPQQSRDERAIALWNDPSPDLPAPSHVYRGF